MQKTDNFLLKIYNCSLY